MPCFAPLTAWYSNEIGASGKRGITFNRNASYSGRALQLPCGKCIGCRLEYSRQWAMRCMHEVRSHGVSDNAFLTLTYDNEHLPRGGSLVPRDLQLFMKRLRKKRGAGIRFYACGEYGDLNQRPHYHVLLFNKGFPDKKFFTRNKRGESIYTSDELRELWPLGHNAIGAVTFESCAYVARYICKKVYGDKADNHYQVMDGDGVLHDRFPEFTRMSRRPGLALGYYEKYRDELLAHDSVVFNGREVGVPRFYDRLTERDNPARLAVLKRMRLRKARLYRSDNTVDRRRVKEVLQLKTMKQRFRRDV